MKKHIKYSQQEGMLMPIIMGLLVITSMMVVTLLNLQNNINKLIFIKKNHLQDKYIAFSLSQKINNQLVSAIYSSFGVKLGEEYDVNSIILGSKKDDFAKDKKEIYEIKFDGSPYIYEYEEEKFIIRFWDAGSLLNFNSLPNNGMIKYLRDIGYEERPAYFLTKRWIDFIDKDNVPILNGAEKTLYRAKNLFEPLNRPYSNLLGITGVYEGNLYHKQEFDNLLNWAISPKFGYLRVNPNLASAKVLQYAYGLKSIQANNIVRQRKKKAFITGLSGKNIHGYDITANLLLGVYVMTDTMTIQIYRQNNLSYPIAEFLTQRLNDAYGQPLIIKDINRSLLSNKKLLSVTQTDDAQDFPKLDWSLSQ